MDAELQVHPRAVVCNESIITGSVTIGVSPFLYDYVVEIQGTCKVYHELGQNSSLIFEQFTLPSVSGWTPEYLLSESMIFISRIIAFFKKPNFRYSMPASLAGSCVRSCQTTLEFNFKHILLLWGSITLIKHVLFM